MPYQQHLYGHFGGSSQKYYDEIMRKKRAGESFTDPGAVDAFKQAYSGFDWNLPHQQPPQQPTPPPQQPAAPQQPGQEPAQDPHSLQPQMTQEVQGVLQQLRDYIGTPHQTPDQVLQSDYGQQLVGAADTMRDRAMRQARAQLAGSGALYPDDTRAASRFAQEGAEHARMLSAQVLPQLLAATQQQRGLGLQELTTMLGAQSGEEARAISEALRVFQTYAPYTMGTWDQINRLPLEWTHAMGQVPGGAQPGGGGMVPARQYVEQMGGQIKHHRSQSGADVITINGRELVVQEIDGAYIQDGRTYLPQWVIDQALGGY